MKTIGLNIGLNSVDPNQYCDWKGRLRGAENDALDFAQAQSASGRFDEIGVILGQGCTLSQLRRKMNEFANELIYGDMLVLFFSGHGAKLAMNDCDSPIPIEVGAWCLYDSFVLEEELRMMIKRFRKGVKVVFFSDSCFAGAILEYFLPSSTASEFWVKSMDEAAAAKLSECYSQEIARRYEYAKAYKSVVWLPTVLFHGACTEDQLAREDTRNGLYTRGVLEVFCKGAFPGNHDDFRNEVEGKVKEEQEPVLDSWGYMHKRLRRQRFLGR